MDLTPEEVRVLGCLLEKSHTTPDHYPLSTNALVSACNQKSSRDPIVEYSSRQVDQISTDLREMGLVRVVRGAGMRTHKHKHIVEEALDITVEQQAVLAVLMLRGPQSHGELKTRTERYVHFADNESVLKVLQTLQNRPDKLVQNIGRESSQSQDRWRHQLGAVDVSEPGSASQPEQSQPGSASQPSSVSHRDDHSVGQSMSQQNTSSPSTTGKGDGELERRVAELERRLSALETSLGIDE